MASTPESLLNPCCLCGLLCAEVAHSAEPGRQLKACPRRSKWIASHAGRSPGADGPGALEALALKHDSLIWIDAADVNTTRAVVDLAKQTGASVHVGQTPGSEVMGRVMASEGWLGTSLSELSQQADLVISVGDRLLSQMPLLAARYFVPQRAAESKGWFHLAASPGQAQAGMQRMEVDRQDWFAVFTDLLMALKSPPAALPAGSPMTDLLAAMRQSKYAALVWQTDDLVDDLDELWVRRLAAIAEQQSKTSRCSLLCLDSSPGRLTAEETLLWLTGCGPTAQYRDGHWRQPPGVPARELADWQSRYASIVIVRAVPTQLPLPALQAELVLTPASELQYVPASAKKVCAVSTTCIDTPGFLFRGDRGGVTLCGESATLGPSSSELTAESILLQATLNAQQVKEGSDAG